MCTVESHREFTNSSKTSNNHQSFLPIAATVKTGNKNCDDLIACKWDSWWACSIFSAMIEVMRVVDHVLVWLFGNDVISPNHPWFWCIHTRVVGCENIIAEEIQFLTILTQLQWNATVKQIRHCRFTLLYYLIHRFSQFLRCEVALHFINTREINDF